MPHFKAMKAISNSFEEHFPLYKAPSHIRSRLDFGDQRKPFIFEYLDDGVDIIKAALDKYNIPQINSILLS